MLHTNLNEMFRKIENDFEKYAQIVSTERWQAMETQGRLDYQSKELLNYDVAFLMPTEDKDYYQKHIIPNLPWADDHFDERVGGEPINPGVQWANWPWGKSAAKHRMADEKFNHNYMERYWPKYANNPHLLPSGHIEGSRAMMPHKGIRHTYGDLRDVVEYLVREPHTRQAYLPIFFPEDTGYGDGGRKPCTLGYQFIMRDNSLNIYYPLRSCDYYKHFRDDVYMTVRLLLWVLGECRKLDSKWLDVRPGRYDMHMTSFHCFYNDYVKLFGKDAWE